ncbi:TPA: hypothetical protein ACIE12_000487 [Streptococcus pyogenes]
MIIQGVANALTRHRTPVSKIKKEGVRQSQTDKNVTIIDAKDYNLAEIDKLLKRKEEILDIISKLDAEPRLLLIRAYVIEKYPSDCIEKYYSEKKYYTVKRIAIDQLNAVIGQQMTVHGQ